MNKSSAIDKKASNMRDLCEKVKLARDNIKFINKVISEIKNNKGELSIQLNDETQFTQYKLLKHSDTDTEMLTLLSSELECAKKEFETVSKSLEEKYDSLIKKYKRMLHP